MLDVRPMLSVAMLACLADAQATVEQWPQPTNGTAVRYRTLNRISQKTAADEHAVEQDIVIRTEETHTVTHIDADGVAILVIERVRVWGTIRGSALQNEVPFDTAEGGRIHPLAKGLVDMFRPATEMRIDRSGSLLSVRRMRRDGELGDPDEHERTTMQFGFVLAPVTPITAGASWRPAEGIHECEAEGCIELETHNKLAEVGDDSLTVTTVAAEDHAEGTDPRHRVQRKIVLSRQDGLLVQMRASGTSRDGPMERTIVLEMDRVLTERPTRHRTAVGR